jgi:hypothetical protein
MAPPQQVRVNQLTDEEVGRLVELGKDIRTSLECDINGKGLPCRTDRFEAVRDMKEYLEVHDYTVVARRCGES